MSDQASPKFVKGQEIVCVDNSQVEESLTVGETYTVIEFRPDRAGVNDNVIVLNDCEKAQHYDASRFRPAEQAEQAGAADLLGRLESAIDRIASPLKRELREVVAALRTRCEQAEQELKLWKPLTREEAEQALAEAEGVPISDEEINAIVAKVTEPAYHPTEPEHVQLAVKVNQLQAANTALREKLAVACHLKADDKVQFDWNVLDRIATLEALEAQTPGRAAVVCQRCAELEALETKVKQMVREGWRHVRKGTILGKEDWRTVIKHLREEVDEFAGVVTDQEGHSIEWITTNAVDELGDILGVVVHAAIKLGVPMSMLGSNECKKLDLRFKPGPAAKSGEEKADQSCVRRESDGQSDETPAGSNSSGHAADSDPDVDEVRRDQIRTLFDIVKSGIDSYKASERRATDDMEKLKWRNVAAGLMVAYKKMRDAVPCSPLPFDAAPISAEAKSELPSEPVKPAPDVIKVPGDTLIRIGSDEFAKLIKEGCERAAFINAQMPQPVASVHVDRDGMRLEIYVDQSKPSYSEWIKGEGADIGILRDMETGKVVGANLPLYAKSIVFGGTTLPIARYELPSGKPIVIQEASEPVKVERWFKCVKLKSGLEVSEKVMRSMIERGVADEPDFFEVDRAGVPLSEERKEA